MQRYVVAPEKGTEWLAVADRKRWKHGLVLGHYVSVHHK